MPIIKNTVKLTLTVCLVSLAILTHKGYAATIWYEDNNLGRAGGIPVDFISKFSNQDTFQNATVEIGVYLMRAKVMDEMSDTFLQKTFLPYLTKNNIKLALNAGGATWTQLRARKRVAERDFALLERLKRLGFKVDYISLQSVLSKTPKRKGIRIDYPLEKRVQDIVAYTVRARAIFPEVTIGLIDALPSKGKEYRISYQKTKEAMVAAGQQLGYIHLDMPFEIPRDQRRGVTWQTVREVEKFVEEDMGMVFGYFTTSRTGGYASSKAYHMNVIADLECYAGSGGTPGDYIIASWFPFPEKTIPENATGEDYPTMRTVLEFGRRLKQIEQGGATWTTLRSLDKNWRSQCGISTTN